MAKDRYKKYKVTFTSNKIPSCSPFLDETPVQVSGYGGWQVVSRQRRTGLTEWQGKDPIRMSIPVLFDGYAEGVGQEIEITNLSRMGLPDTEGLSAEPPVVQIQSNGVPNPGPKYWVIEDIQWGTNVIWDNGPDGSMVRMRQDAVVGVMQYVAEDRTAFSNSPIGKGGSADKPGSKGFQKPYKVRNGDTLQKIANKVYKKPKPGDWKIIAKANGINDPRHLKIGRTLKIPRK